MNADQYNSENEKSLTQVDEHVQYAAASVGVEPACEADEATIQTFIETLVRIAHAVATRKSKQQEKTER